ncbi:MAG: porin [Crocinitomicaceae bacterium]|nr:porin [Crocinitomicaceae bacterium]
MKKIIPIVFICFITFCYSQDFTKNPFGKGIINVMSSDSSWSTKVAFRFQSRYDGEFNFSDSSFSNRAYVRRARIKGHGFAFSPKIQYKFEYDVANGQVLDAVLKWNFAGNWSIWFGQTKLPGNIERVFSSQKLQLVYRSLLNKYFTLDRDAGFQLRHKLHLGKTFLVRTKFAVSQGEGLNRKAMSSGNGYTGRVELLPFGDFTKKGDYFASDLKREDTPKLMLSVTYDFNDNAVRQGGQMGDDIMGSTRDLQSIQADAHFKYKGLSFFGEYANRVSTDGGPINDLNEAYHTGSAINLQTGYLFKNNWELAGRYTQVNFEEATGLDNFTQYTFGFSKYVVGHNLKIQGDFGITQEENNEDLIFIRLQTEFNF